jgi:hypothetical protein
VKGKLDARLRSKFSTYEDDFYIAAEAAVGNSKTFDLEPVSAGVRAEHVV